MPLHQFLSPCFPVLAPSHEKEKVLEGIPDFSESVTPAAARGHLKPCRFILGFLAFSISFYFLKNWKAVERIKLHILPSCPKSILRRYFCALQFVHWIPWFSMENTSEGFPSKPCTKAVENFFFHSVNSCLQCLRGLLLIVWGEYILNKLKCSG